MPKKGGKGGKGGDKKGGKGAKDGEVDVAVVMRKVKTEIAKVYHLSPAYLLHFAQTWMLAETTRQEPNHSDSNAAFPGHHGHGNRARARGG